MIAVYLDLIFLSLSIAAGYLWMQIPFLQQYSLQGFALAIIVFFALKFFSRHRHDHWPSSAVFELVPLVFALILLVGATGASQSSYFALLYIFLLLLVLTTKIYTSIIVTAELVFVLYALSLQLAMSDWRQLLSLPIMLGFFLYINQQLLVSQRQRQQLASSSTVIETISNQKLTLERFVGEFLKPKLAALARLGREQDTSKQVVLNQLDLLENEIDKMLARPEQVSPSQPIVEKDPQEL